MARIVCSLTYFMFIGTVYNGKILSLLEIPHQRHPWIICLKWLQYPVDSQSPPVINYVKKVFLFLILSSWGILNWVYSRILHYWFSAAQLCTTIEFCTIECNKKWVPSGFIFLLFMLTSNKHWEKLICLTPFKLRLPMSTFAIPLASICIRLLMELVCSADQWMAITETAALTQSLIRMLQS